MMTSKTGILSRLIRRLFTFVLIGELVVLAVPAKADPRKTLIQDIVYRADGSVAHGTLTISWTAFATAEGEAVAAGTLTVKTDTNGGISVPLVPNTGANPAGTYYKVIVRTTDGVRSEETWVVPSVPSTTIAAIRASVIPQAQAAQFVGRDYVDTQMAKLSTTTLVHLTGDETIGGTKTFSVSPNIPVPVLGTSAASKAYVDQAMTLIQSGKVALATQLASMPSQCSGNQFSMGIAANGNANCSPLPVASGELPGGVLAKDCSMLGASYVLQRINTDGTETCVQVNAGYAGISADGSNGLSVQGSILLGKDPTQDLQASTKRYVDNAISYFTVSPEKFGAYGDYAHLTCSVTIGTTSVTCSDASFVASDVGKRIFVAGAGNYGYYKWLDTTIVAVDSTSSVTVADSAANTVSSQIGGYGHDDNTALQACWNYSSVNGTVCQMGYKTYLFDGTALKIRNQMAVRGISAQSTILMCGPSVINPGSVYSPVARECVTNESAQFVKIERLTLQGVEGSLAPPPSVTAASTSAADIRAAQITFLTQAQHGIHIDVEASTAKGTAVYQHSDMESVLIFNFWGDGLWLDSYEGSNCAPYSCAAQFLIFKQVHIWYPWTNGIPPVVYKYGGTTPINGANFVTNGQNDQINFEGGELDGTINGKHGINVISNGCTVCNFWGDSAQWSEYGFIINSGSNWHWSQGWIENVQHVLTDYGPQSSDIAIEHSTIANSGHTTGLTGWLYASYSQQEDGLLAYNRINGASSPDIGVQGYCAAPANSSNIGFHHNTYNDSGQPTFGVAATRCTTPQIVTANTLYLREIPLSVVNGDGGTIPIQNINSVAYDGTVSVQAYGNSLQLVSGGNLNLGGLSSPVTVNANGVATFRSRDLGGSIAWVLVSCNGCTSSANTVQVGPQATLNLGAATTAIVNTDSGTTPIANLSGTFPVGSIIGLTGWPSNSTSYFKLVNSGNIWFPNSATSLSVYGGCTVFVQYTNFGTGFVVLGMSCSFPPMRGRATLVGGTVTVNSYLVQASSYIQLTNCGTGGGTPGILSVGTVTAGTSFVINSSSSTDKSVVCWSLTQ